MAQPGACRLDGVRAVVTGASSGIGAAIAEAFGAAGATVLLTHRDSEEEASAVAGRIGALVAQADLRTRDACEALVAQARERLGGLDVWVNNAGADVLTGEAADWDWERKLELLLAVDLKGTVACSYAAGAVMGEQPSGGTILNMSWDHVTDRNGGPQPGAVQRGKGRGARLQQEPRAQPGAPGPRQRAVPRMDRDGVRAPGRPATSAARLWSPRRSHAGAGRRTSPRRRSGLPRRRRRSSPVRPSTSTVAL